MLTGDSFLLAKRGRQPGFVDESTTKSAFSVGLPGTNLILMAHKPPILYNRRLRSERLAPRRSFESHLRGFHQRNADRGKGLLKPTFEK